MQAKVINLENGEAGEIELDDGIFGLEPRADILHRMVNYQLAKRRAGTHKVKGRHEVARTGAKPFKQKGTGRARQGSWKAPNHRGGGVAHGPVVRSHAHDLPKKVRRLAMLHALSSKRADDKLIIVDTASLDEAKTKGLAAKLKGLGLSSALIVDGMEPNENFVRAARNIPMIDVLPSQGANVYDILRREHLVLTRAAVEALEARLK
ncbi:50S ribosomal protein L4 [Minwuia thermotolerans]|jgi:large subunit ribosomal protein L4|uniref:Large ribosomal subunit protein uL4 n=1 Tax=Minwuia thermotolerans TaxID=2056226 RepID=A0A2M9FYE5_9PROT|nr:50S ribosomal protein L4 [Minwuia thermotolerans]ANK83143.1 MAG: 50S ribosomal protein L4 [Rhizobiales bacterium NRL2]PJK28483.1 50S ribosomal protein L4 [Minwuia thermotolerans]